MGKADHGISKTIGVESQGERKAKGEEQSISGIVGEKISGGISAGTPEPAETEREAPQTKAAPGKEEQQDAAVEDGGVGLPETMLKEEFKSTEGEIQKATAEGAGLGDKSSGKLAAMAPGDKEGMTVGGGDVGRLGESVNRESVVRTKEGAAPEKTPKEAVKPADIASLESTAASPQGAAGEKEILVGTLVPVDLPDSPREEQGGLDNGVVTGPDRSVVHQHLFWLY